jgi:tetratricopeptide (TPR) repeat protein
MSMRDFVNYAADHTRNFTGREWVFQAVNDWLAKTDGSRVFLLTGEPGSGKTAIAGRLTEFSQGLSAPRGLPFLTYHFLSAVYFCSARAALRIDPREFSKSISLQLAERHKAYQEALIAVGEKNINISIQQRIERAESGAEIKGVMIENLDLAGLNPQEAFNRAVLEPLRMVYDQEFDEPITVLVDALDESLAHVGRVTIVELLSGLEDLPSQVRFILTSRPDEQVENRVWDADNLFISGPAYDERNREDINDYVRKRLRQEESLTAKIGRLEPKDATGLARTITDKAQGNFQYVSFLLDAVAGGHRNITDLERLPEGLDALYYDSLNRVVRLGGRNWATDYAPLLGVLSVAQANLTFARLEDFIGHSEESVWQSLVDLRQFIEELVPKEDQEDTEWEYRLYHQSVADFLHHKVVTRKGQRTPNRYYLSAKEQHQRIVNHYRSGASSWEEVDWSETDNYGLRYLTYHLRQAGYHGELYALLTASPNWMNHEFIALTGDMAYVEDLDFAIAELSNSLGVDDVPILAKLHTARQVASTWVSRYTDDALRVLVWLGREDEALTTVWRRDNVSAQLGGLLAIYYALKRRGQTDIGLLDQAEKVVRMIGAGRERADAFVLLSSALADAGRYQQALMVVGGIDYPWERDRALVGVAAAFSVAGNHDEALAIARVIIGHREWRGRALINDAAAMSQLGDHRTNELYVEALGVAREIDEENHPSRDVVLEEVVQASIGLAVNLAQKGRETQARALLDEAKEAAHIIGSPLSLEDLFEEALRAARGMEVDKDRALWLEKTLEALRNVERKADRIQLLSSIAVNVAQAGHQPEAEALLAEAVDIARDIEERQSREMAMKTLAITLAELGLPDRALAIARAIADRRELAEVLITVAGAFARAHDERAPALFAEALEIERDSKGHESQTWTWALIALTRALFELEDERAEELFEEAQVIAHNIQDARERAEALGGLAGVLSWTGDKQRAEELFWQAVEASNAIEYQEDWEWALIALAAVALELGDYEEAVDITHNISAGPRRATALTSLAKALARSGDQRARGVFEEALEAARTTTLEFEPGEQEVAPDEEELRLLEISFRGMELWNLTAALAQSRRYDEALRAARHIQAKDVMDRALSDLAGALIEAERYDEARGLARVIGGDIFRARLLIALAAILARSGDQRAREVLEEALEAAQAINDKGERITSLRILATALAQRERFGDALRILSFHNLDEFLRTLAEWTPYFERSRAGLSIRALLETTSVAGWLHPAWRHINSLLSTSSPNK